MTLLSAAFVLPALWIGMLLRTEVGVAIAAVTAQIHEGAFRAARFVRALPWIGDDLRGCWTARPRPRALRARLTEVGAPERNVLLTLIGDVGHPAAKSWVLRSSRCSSSTATASACSSRWWRCCAASSASVSIITWPRSAAHQGGGVGTDRDRDQPGLRCRTRLLVGRCAGAGADGGYRGDRGDPSARRSRGGRSASGCW